MDNNTGGLHKFDMTNLGLKTLKVVLCSGMQIHKIKEPLSGMRFTTQEDISIAVRQQMTRFTHGAANGIHRLSYRWQLEVTVAVCTEGWTDTKGDLIFHNYFVFNLWL